MNGIEKATGFISNRQDRWLLSSKSNGVAHYKVYIMCDVTFDRTVYFTAGFDKNSSASSAYIDNINIVEGYLYNKPQKATYGDPYIVYQIDFESEFEQPITADNWRYDVLHYERSSAEAHSGKYSVRYDPAHKDGWQYLHFTDSMGIPSQLIWNRALHMNCHFGTSQRVHMLLMRQRDISLSAEIFWKCR